MNTVRILTRFTSNTPFNLHLTPVLAKNQCSYFSNCGPKTSSPKKQSVLLLNPLCKSVVNHQSWSGFSSSSWLGFSSSSALSRTDRFIVGKSKMKVKPIAEVDKSGDEVVNIDALVEAEEEVTQDEEAFKVFSDETTPDQLFNGIKFKDLPNVLIRLHKHNTRIIARHADGRYIWHNSPSMHGFLHAKKRTAVAGQVAGLNMGQKLRGLGIRTIRVRINGFNQARIATVKGITQAGINIVAIADVTTVDWGWCQRAKSAPSKN